MNAVRYIIVAILSIAFVSFFAYLIYRLIKGAFPITEFEGEPEYNEDNLNEYFFLYADSPRYPYKAGWTRVLAPNLDIAHKLFNAFHPAEIEGLTNCAAVYDGDTFRQTNISITISSIVLPKSAYKKIFSVEYKYFNKRFSRLVAHLAQFGKNRRIKKKNIKRAFGRFTGR